MIILCNIFALEYCFVGCGSTLRDVPIVPLDGVDTTDAIMVWEVGLCEDVVPMCKSSKVQKMVQHLENQSNMQVCF